MVTQWNYRLHFSHAVGCHASKGRKLSTVMTFPVKIAKLLYESNCLTKSMNFALKALETFLLNHTHRLFIRKLTQLMPSSRALLACFYL